MDNLIQSQLPFPCIFVDCRPMLYKDSIFVKLAPAEYSDICFQYITLPGRQKEVTATCYLASKLRGGGERRWERNGPCRLEKGRCYVRDPGLQVLIPCSFIALCPAVFTKPENNRQSRGRNGSDDLL